MLRFGFVVSRWFNVGSLSSVNNSPLILTYPQSCWSPQSEVTGVMRQKTRTGLSTLPVCPYLRGGLKCYFSD